MGIYLNPGNISFQTLLRGLYIDKSELISFINQTLGTADKLTCVSRPRRFGKSFAAKMLCAYYDKSCDSKELFRNLKISQDISFYMYLNKFDVLYLDITWFISNSRNIRETVTNLQTEVISELKKVYVFLADEDIDTLPKALASINEKTNTKFIIIIDEWDALFRESKEDKELHKDYVNLLRGLFRSNLTDKMIEAAYMTGILPIKKYGNQSALSDFQEYTMINPIPLEEYVGFTEVEVRNLCEEYKIDFMEMQRWYDGYALGENLHIYNPKSVLDVIKRKRFSSYWTQTETYEALKLYIDMDFDGLKTAIILMLGGAKYKINTRKFQNDMANIRSKDDVLTLLVHLGYLAFNPDTSEVFIPNQEVSDEFKNAIEGGGWEEVANALKDSERLLQATIQEDEKMVAKSIDEMHMSTTSVLAYHDENSLSCVISIAYYSARKDYVMIRELPAGKGFADIVFVPKKHIDKPAIIVELKWDQTAEGAIAQIKDREYVKALEEYRGNLLMVGINYSKKNKRHTCTIEKMEL